MRISDWSSDVCSSDLQGAGRPVPRQRGVARPARRRRAALEYGAAAARRPAGGLPAAVPRHQACGDRGAARGQALPLSPPGKAAAVAKVRLRLDGVARAAHPATGDRHGGRLRSEEHTSELQSLMRISYAVFCLKKKKITHL